MVADVPVPVMVMVMVMVADVQEVPITAEATSELSEDRHKNPL